jgi:hypothetical protein
VEAGSHGALGGQNELVGVAAAVAVYAEIVGVTGGEVEGLGVTLAVASQEVAPRRLWGG